VLDLERTAPDGSAIEACEEEVAAGRRQFVWIRRNGLPRLKAMLEPVLKLPKVSLQRRPRTRRAGVGQDNLNGGRAHEPLDLLHRGDEPLALILRQRSKDRSGVAVRETI